MRKPKKQIASAGRIRIAYLVSQYPAVNHTFVLREVRALRRLGAELHVASISDPDRPVEKMTPDEIEEAESTFFVKSTGLLSVLGEHVGTLLSRPFMYLNGLFYALSLGRYHPRQTLYSFLYFVEAVVVGRWMIAKQLSHVHLHFSSTVGLIMKHIFPISMSMTIHGPGEFEDPDDFYLAEKIHGSSFVCAISNYSRSQLMKGSDHSEWGKFDVSPLGIDPYVFAPKPRRATPQITEILFVGRLAPVKAQHILISAVALMRQHQRKVRLRLVGDGPDRHSLEAQVSSLGLSDCIVFEGWRNQDEVLKLYEQADIFALPSFAEGVPVVLMEAMAMEIPCVASRITGIPELIRDGVDGLLVAPSSVEELVEAVVKLIDDPQLRYRLGKSGRARVLEKYDLERNTERLMKIMENRLAGPALELQEQVPVWKGQAIG